MDGTESWSWDRGIIDTLGFENLNGFRNPHCKRERRRIDSEKAN